MVHTTWDVDKSFNMGSRVNDAIRWIMMMGDGGMDKEQRKNTCFNLYGD